MSRLPVHRKRRCYFLWLPIAIIGCAIYIYSLGLTLTANGLTVIGLAIIASGVAPAVREASHRWNS